jgi:hypothetical protein
MAAGPDQDRTPWKETIMERWISGGWTRRRFGLVAGGLLPTLLGITPWQEAAAKSSGHEKAAFTDVSGTGISGFANLQQLHEGTNIVVVAKGLQPGTQYFSLYYENSTCELEAYGPGDFIGGTDPYTANAAEIGHTHGKADDDLDEIHSVSVRLASDFSLQACATL